MKHLEYAVYKIQENGLGVQGETLFIGTLPADVKKGIMVRDILDPARVDEEMVDWFQQTFQVIVRDPDYESGHAIATEVSKILNVYHVQFDSIYMNRLRPMEKPMSFPRGDGDEIETAVRFKVSYGETP